VVPVAGTAPPAALNPRLEILIIIGILPDLLMGALDNFVALTALPTILTQFGQPNSGRSLPTPGHLLAERLRSHSLSLGSFSSLLLS
jgi:hypothetical protein